MAFFSFSMEIYQFRVLEFRRKSEELGDDERVKVLRGSLNSGGYQSTILP